MAAALLTRLHDNDLDLVFLGPWLLPTRSLDRHVQEMREAHGSLHETELVSLHTRPANAFLPFHLLLW